MSKCMTINKFYIHNYEIKVSADNVKLIHNLPVSYAI